MRLFSTTRLTMLGIALAGTALWAGPTLAASESFTVQLTGAQQVPAVQTNGSATADLAYNPRTHVLTWTIHYNDLSSPVTMAHFHMGAAGENGKPVLWLSKKGAKGPAPDPIKGRAKLTPAQAKEFLAGQWYINIHTSDHPAGEVRGQVMPPSGG